MCFFVVCQCEYAFFLWRPVFLVFLFYGVPFISPEKVKTKDESKLCVSFENLLDKDVIFVDAAWTHM